MADGKKSIDLNSFVDRQMQVTINCILASQTTIKPQSPKGFQRRYPSSSTCRSTPTVLDQL